jgi:hypothetical protein
MLMALQIWIFTALALVAAKKVEFWLYTGYTQVVRNFTISALFMDCKNSLSGFFVGVGKFLMVFL